MLDDVKNLISKGETDNAFVLLCKYSDDHKFQKYVIKLEARFNRAKKDHQKGIETYENYQIATNRVVDELLLLIKQLEEGTFENDPKCGLEFDSLKLTIGRTIYSGNNYQHADFKFGFTIVNKGNMTVKGFSILFRIPELLIKHRGNSQSIVDLPNDGVYKILQIDDNNTLFEKNSKFTFNRETILRFDRSSAWQAEKNRVIVQLHQIDCDIKGYEFDIFDYTNKGSKNINAHSFI